MNGDKKTGLALGVLLVGIVGAFFFRNESSPLDEPMPQLENPQKIDAEIAEKPRIPYLTGVETDTALTDAPPFSPISTSEAGRGATLEPTLNPGAFDSPFVDTAPPPDPIRSPAGDARFSHNNAWEVVGANSPPTAQPVTSTTHHDRSHEVKQGDTLSGLAYQYLGSSARYHEIFQANRDLLKSPNDLRIGMKLKIPPREAAPTAGRGQNIPARTIKATDGPTTRNATSPANNVELLPETPEIETAPAEPRTPADGRMFRPVPRQPFFPGRSGAATSSKQIPVQPVKSLSQQPPHDVPSPDDAAWTSPSPAAVKANESGSGSPSTAAPPVALEEETNPFESRRE